MDRDDLYAPDPNWSPRLHTLLGVPWPCGARADFERLWPDVVTSLTDQGLRVGRATYGGWNDGDPAFTSAVWCLVAHLRPEKVLETGVARGLTSRVILEGLERNERGGLWSIDLPHFDTRLNDQIGAAVPGASRSRWTYVPGASRRRLPSLVGELAQVDLFVHDSLHTGRNVRFELEEVWPALRPGGAVVVDDISHSLGFHEFSEDVAPGSRLTARHADGGGLWGILLKGAPAAGARDVDRRPARTAS